MVSQVNDRITHTTRSHQTMHVHAKVAELH